MPDDLTQFLNSVLSGVIGFCKKFQPIIKMECVAVLHGI